MSFVSFQNAIWQRAKEKGEELLEDGSPMTYRVDQETAPASTHSLEIATPVPCTIREVRIAMKPGGLEAVMIIVFDPVEAELDY